MKERGSRYIYLLSAGHMFADMNQGALPALLPFLIAEHKYSYATAASLVFALNLVSSVVQPVFGAMADKTSKPWIMPMGVLLAGCGLAATGFVSSYPLLFFFVMISGIGIAAYHPEAARWANKVSGQRKGAGVSIFSFGGNAGFALGPMVVTSLILLFGLGGISLMFIPAVLIAVVLMRNMRGMQEEHLDAGKKKKAGGEAPEKDRWGAFSLLCVLLFSRSFIFYGINTFLPLYWIHYFKQSEAAGNTALSLMLTVGAICTLIGGRLADRYGFRLVIRAGFVWLLPMLAIFSTITNVYAATLMLVPIGMGLYLPLTAMVVTGQRFLPNRIGLASGVTLGLAVSVGGLSAPILGAVADKHGLEPVMAIVAAVAVIPAVLAFFLPKPQED